MVLVSHRHRFIYLKTKKTASTSVEAFFERFCLENPEDHTPAEHRDDHVGPAGIIGSRSSRAKRAAATWHAHMSAREVLWHLGPRRFLGYFRFTTIRNPFERCVSQFLYLHRNDRALMTAPLADRRAAFLEWIAANGVPSDRSVYCLAGRSIVHDVIRFERLAEDVARIARRLGLPADTALLPAFKKSDATPRDPYAGYYTPAVRDAAARVYRDEIRRYGYTFDGEATPDSALPASARAKATVSAPSQAAAPANHDITGAA